MSEEEHGDLNDLKQGIERALLLTGEQINLNPADADDVDHQALINKAIYYRNLLKTINDKLTDRDT